VTLCGASGLHRAVQGAWQAREDRSTPAPSDVTSLPDFVSQGMIRGLQPGTVLNVAANAIVTHLARDDAAASGVRIRREGE